MKRAMCVWLPDWPLQRIGRDTPPAHKQRPLVLYAESPRSGLRVVARCAQAAGRGVAAGMPLAEAKGLLETSIRPGGSVPLLAAGHVRTHSRSPSRTPAASSAAHQPLFLSHQPADDLQALNELAVWCQRFSPVVGIEAPDSLLLDVTGCAHLFGGERKLSRKVDREFQERGFCIRTAIADTIGAAWGLAHFARRRHEIAAAGEQESALRPLPIHALRLSPRVLETLYELDIRRIEQLLALPRASLPSRFGPEVVRRLDQALGTLGELITPVKPPEPVTAARDFEHPLGDRRTLEAVLRQLAEQIVQQVTKRQQGVQRLEVRLEENCGLRIVDFGFSEISLCEKSAIQPHSNSTAAQSEITFTIDLLHPSQSLPHIMELLQTKLEQLPVEAEVTNVRLNAVAAALREARQGRMFAVEGDSAAERELARFVDRLSNRLGKERVVRPLLRPDPQPEFANQWVPVLGGMDDGGRKMEDSKTSIAIFHPLSSILHLPSSIIPTLRPLCLYREPQPVEATSRPPGGPPVRFCWRQTLYDVVRHWGPERIETGWYRGRHVRRDYYRVETTCGLRCWLFRRIDRDDWFLHGVFD